MDHKPNNAKADFYDSDDSSDSADEQPQTHFSASSKRKKAFQTYPCRTEIKKIDLSLVNSADHIGFRRPYLLWHQAIVINVDAKNGRLLIVHYKKEGGSIIVKEEWIDVEKEWGDLFRFDYPAEVLVRNPTKKVIERARSKVGEEGYDLFSNNCQHFATFCKTGVKESPQVNWASAKVHEAYDVMRNKMSVEINLSPLPVTYTASGTSGKIAAATMLNCVDDLCYLTRMNKGGLMGDKDFVVSATQRMCEAVASSSFGIVGNSIARSALESTFEVIAEAGGVAVGTMGSVVGTAGGSVFGQILGNLLSR